MNIKKALIPSAWKAAIMAGLFIVASSGSLVVAESGGEDSVRLKAAVEYPMGEFAQSVALADLTGNGHLDVMTANRNNDSVPVRLGAGDGFGEETVYASDPEPLFVRVDRVTSAAIEAVNGLIQLTRRRARGYRNFGNLRAIAYWTAGNLDLELPEIYARYIAKRQLFTGSTSTVRNFNNSIRISPIDVN